MEYNTGWRVREESNDFLKQREQGLDGTFHDLFATDAYLAWLVPSQRRAGVWVDDLQLRVPDDGAAGAGLHLERLLGEGQAHGQHGPCLGHPIALVETNTDFSVQYRISPLGTKSCHIPIPISTNRTYRLVQPV